MRLAVASVVLAVIATIALLLTQASAAGLPDHPERVVRSCNGTIVQAEASYGPHGPNADLDQETLTFRFEEPPPKGFVFQIRREGDDAPYQWAAWLDGEPCSKCLH